MASLRLLPSGRWQASVLLDDGSRTTKTFDSETDAAQWGVEVEIERDRIRAEKRSLDDDRRVLVLIANLQQLAEEGYLTELHRSKIVSILESAVARAG